MPSWHMENNVSASRVFSCSMRGFGAERSQVRSAVSLTGAAVHLYNNSAGPSGYR
ncbi:hypothetical protein [Amycolatopsis sp. GA6-003]|uniref:hypothetical protein n=1 Tax=Amycolatopsis sp. GA6-003 TaxID=2652444 RepID=UPI0039170F37